MKIEAVSGTNQTQPINPRNSVGGIWLTIAAAILILGGLWGFCAWEKWGGDRTTAHDPTELMVYTIFTAVATGIVVPGVLLHVLKLHALATRGVTTQGRVEKISTFGKHGLSPTTVAYTVADREYRIRRDLPRNRVAVGGTITVLYDPLNPKRFTLIF